MTFTRFIPTPENRSALAAVQHLAACLASDHSYRGANPFYLHGPAGSGKSHLLSVLVEEVVRRAPDRVFTLFQAGDFEARLRSEANEPDPLQAARQSDLFILEDVQHLSARGPSAEALVQLFDYRQARQRQLVFTATIGPGQLLCHSARLICRFGCGLVVGLAPLHSASRLALLQDKAQRRQLAVTREVLVWLAEHLSGSGRQLEGALAQLEMLARLHARPLDVQTVAGHFRDLVEAGRPTVERIAQRVGRYFRVEPRHLQARGRSHKVLLPRQVGMYLARQLTDLSLEQIGSYFGGRDHSTVLHACRKIEEALGRDAVLSGTVRQLHADLG